MYWPVGNPVPVFDRSVRGDGDNLYTDSVVALDPDTGQRKWHYPRDGNLIALDARTGEHLWHYSTGQPNVTQTAPMSYSVDGRQYVALQAGSGVLFSFALPNQTVK